ncbi:DUF2752 domain-containing protein [Polymorphospora sp. NPDC050346]|uniref:DUF2752 domain-containing protein n=1 Tax=Polymorphospora sp. NPDC050346 TaxID=3155780 RepID=UPI0034109C0E
MAIVVDPKAGLTTGAPAPDGPEQGPPPVPAGQPTMMPPAGWQPGPDGQWQAAPDGWQPGPDGQWQPAPAFVPAEPDRFTRFMTKLWNRAPRWAAPVAALGCVAAALGTVLVMDPTRSSPDAMPSCLLKMTTGLDCPGCGGTRAVWYLMHGDLGAAARHHLVFVFVVPFLVYLYVAWAAQHMFGRRLPQLRVTPKTIGVVLAVWFTFSALRNLPWAPFDWFYV